MANIAQSFVTYLKDSYAELKKVAWPSKKDVTRYSILVVVSVAVVSAAFSTLDYGLSEGLNKLIEAIS